MTNKKRVNGIINIPTSLSGNFFRYWLEFLIPFHRLSPREMDVATSFIKHRYILSKAIKDDEILDRVTMSEETKQKIRDDCKISPPHFQVIMGKLRKANIIVDNKLNPKFIPKNINEGDKSFDLLLHFSLDEEGNK